MRTTFLRWCAVCALAGGLGGCAWVSSWFARPPVAPAPVITTPRPAIPEEDADVQPASAARAACANYDDAVQSAPFPRDAIIRGIDAGRASVRFLIDGAKITVLSVRSSDPAFGNAAVDIVRALACRVDRPMRVEVPFSWRTQR